MSIRKAIVAVAVTVFAVGLSVGLSQTAMADPVVPATTWNEIFIPFDNAAGNHLCVDVPNGSTSPGLALQFYSCHGYSSGGTNQRWHFQTFSRNGQLAAIITNTASGLCIDGQFSLANVRVVQQTCTAETPSWLIVPQNDNGTDPLVQLELLDANGFASGLCMAAGNMGDHNSTPIVATTCQPLQPTPGDLSQALELA